MKTLSILLHDESIGYLSQSPSGYISFRFHESYISDSNRFILGQNFEDNLLKTYVGRNRALPPYFANLIPEPGPLRNFLEKSLNINPNDDMVLLEAVGNDLPGAVRVLPTDEIHQFEPALEDTSTELSFNGNEANQKTSKLRFSLAGVQMKFSVLRNPEKISLPAHNQDGDWIVKFGSPSFPDLVENEYAIMEWARASGFDVPECHIQSITTVDESLGNNWMFGDKVFVIRRYDRTSNSRLHQEDFAQVTGLKPILKYDQIKYEQCAAIIGQLMGEEGYNEFIRRLVFTIASGNADAHLKNWSLLYKDGKNPNLAPMYDQLSTIAWPEVESELALKLAGTKNWFNLDLRRFEILANRAGGNPTKTGELVNETLHKLIIAWNDSRIRELLPTEHSRQLQIFWDRVPILKPWKDNLNWI